MSKTKRKNKNIVGNVQNKGYSEGAASYVKKSLKGFVPNSGNPQEDIDFNNCTLRQRSRMLYMTAPLAASAIKTNRTNVIGNGLKLKSTINRNVLNMTQEEAEAWQKKTEAEFDLWASSKRACDATGMNDFYGIQQLCLISWLLSGDVFAVIKHFDRSKLMPYGLRLHLIEADRVRTPIDLAKGVSGGVLGYTNGETKEGNKIYDGVELDANGSVRAYHIANTHPFQSVIESTEFTRVEAYGANSGLPNVLHIMESERPEQFRGVPYLAHVIEPLLQMDRYTKAEIMSALVQSFFTAFITSEKTTSEIPFNEPMGEDVQEVSNDPNEYEMGAGTINFLNQGQDVKFAAPTHPNSGFDVFMRAMAEHTGAALEIPADLLLKAFNSSYSASRAALMEAWKAFKMRREWLTNDFCKPVYEIWMTEAVALGRISAPAFFTDPVIRKAYLGSEWIGAPAGQLDPTKEISAAVMAIENGLSTREAETIKLNGGSFTANADKLTAENERLRIAKGEEKEQNPLQNYVETLVKNAFAKEVANFETWDK